MLFTWKVVIPLNTLNSYKTRIIIFIYWENLRIFTHPYTHYLIIRNSRLSYKYDEIWDMYQGLEVNIAIASAITAGAKVHIVYLKKES